MIDGRPSESLDWMGKLWQNNDVEDAAAPLAEAAAAEAAAAEAAAAAEVSMGRSSKSVLRGVGGVGTSGAEML